MRTPPFGPDRSCSVVLGSPWRERVFADDERLEELHAARVGLIGAHVRGVG